MIASGNRTRTQMSSEQTNEDHGVLYVVPMGDGLFLHTDILDRITFQLGIY